MFYRDFLIVPGEDKVFVLSSLWRTLHTYQRQTGAKIVSVPIKYDRSNKKVMLSTKNSGIANGFRVFAEKQDELNILLSARIEDAIQVKQIKACETSDKHCISVKRVYTKEERMRKKKGKKFVEHDFTHFFWYKKDNVAFPYHVDVSKNNGHFKFESKNTFGCGCVPVNL